MSAQFVYFDCLTFLRPIGPSERGEPPFTITGYTNIISATTSQSLCDSTIKALVMLYGVKHMFMKYAIQFESLLLNRNKMIVNQFLFVNGLCTSCFHSLA